MINTRAHYSDFSKNMNNFCKIPLLAPDIIVKNVNVWVLYFSFMLILSNLCRFYGI